MRRNISNEVLAEINLTIEEIERRKALLKYRKEQGIELVPVNRGDLLNVLNDPQVRNRAAAIVFDHELLEIIHSFWQNIDSSLRTNAIMSHRIDNFFNEVKLTGNLGIKAVCFIQEGYTAPEVAVDLYSDPLIREGIESFVNRMGQVTFLDVEINEAWPEGIRRLLQASLLAHYQAIVCPLASQEEGSIEGIGDDSIEGGDGEDSDDDGTDVRMVKYRRAHLRNLPEGYRASARQLALAIQTGKFNQRDIERIIRGGRRQTFVKEVLRPEEGEPLPPIDPRKLYRKVSPIKFLNAYLSLSGH